MEDGRLRNGKREGIQQRERKREVESANERESASRKRSREEDDGRTEEQQRVSWGEIDLYIRDLKVDRRRALRC